MRVSPKKARPPLPQFDEQLSAELPPLRHVRDIIYFDGPLTSLFLADDGGAYIYHWYDCDATYNRWLVFAVSPQQLEGLEHLKPDSIGNIIKALQQVYVADLDSKCKAHRTWLVPVGSLEHKNL